MSEPSPGESTDVQPDLDGLDRGDLRTAVWSNSFRLLQPRLTSTGFRVAPLRLEGLPSQPARSAAEEFLVGSRLRRSDPEFESSVGSYFTPAGRRMTSLLGREAARGLGEAELGESAPLPMALGAAIARRRSVRSYTGEAIPKSYLATLLRSSGGITSRFTDADGRQTLGARATPSGGGLYPVELHVAALRVDRLERGVYVYAPEDDRLVQTVGQGALDELLSAVAAPDLAIMTGRAAAFFLLIGRPWRAMRKYGDRGMRHVFLEAGEMAAHLNLAAAALGLGSVDSSSMYDDEVHEALGLDGVLEALIHTVVVGVPG